MIEPPPANDIVIDRTSDSNCPPRRWSAVTAALAMLWLILWTAIDWWQTPEPEFFLDATPLLAWYVLAVIALAGLLSWRSRPAPQFAAVLCLATGVVPLPLLIAGIAATYLTAPWLTFISLVGVFCLFTYLARGLHALTSRPQWLAAVCGLLFVAGFIWLTNALDAIPDMWTSRETATSTADAAEVDAEGLLFGQAARIDHALDAMGRGSSTASQAFFLGFAGVGEEKVFTQEIGLASRILAERYGIGARSLSLINDDRDLEGAPIASVTGLAYALHGLAAHMHLDKDVLFLAISSHGSPDPAIAVSNSQLPLNDLTPDALADALAQSGIRWRVIIVSACYAGGFIEPLKNAQTIVIAASAPDRTSFGCGSASDLTYFGEAFYRDALPSAGSLHDAFDKAKLAIANREQREHVDSSRPQADFGPALEEKLTTLEH